MVTSRRESAAGSECGSLGFSPGRSLAFVAQLPSVCRGGPLGAQVRALIRGAVPQQHGVCTTATTVLTYVLTHHPSFRAVPHVSCAAASALTRVRWAAAWSGRCSRRQAASPPSCTSWPSSRWARELARGGGGQLDVREAGATPRHGSLLTVYGKWARCWPGAYVAVALLQISK